MTNNSLWKVVPAVLTLALVACQDSITGISDPVLAAAPVEVVEAVAPVALVTAGPCFRPGVGMISWWPGDVDGDYADIVGTNPIARYQGVSFEPGIVDGAFRMNGIAGHYMEIDDSETLHPDAFTIDLWAERKGEGQRPSDIYGNMLVQKAISNPSSGGSLWSYFISWRGDGTLAAGVYFENDPGKAGGPVRIETTESFPNDVPIFIALSVASPEDGRLVTLYVNGVPKGTFDASGLGAVSYGDGDMVIGNQYRELRRIGFHRTFDGIIDEVGIFSEVVPIEDLQAIYAAGSSGKCKLPNEAPVVDPVTGGPVDEGSPFETSVTFTDDDSGAWTAVVDYGDGTVDNDATVTGTSVALSHVYAQDGTYPVTVTVTDDLLEPGSSSASVVVNNVAPVVDAGRDATILEGETFNSSGSFMDPGADTWTATVDYGDGSGVQTLALSGKTFDLSHTHTYTGGGSFTVTVTVDDGSVVSLAAMVLSVDEVDVTVVFPLTIDQATVKLTKGRNWFRRRGKDSYQVDGRIPVEFLALFDPATEDMIVTFAGIEETIPAGSFVRRGGRSHKLRYKAPKHSTGIQRIDLHDDGRFKIQAKGPFDPDLHYANLGEPVDFSLVLGTDIGEASIQLDRRLHYRAHRGRDRDHGGDDDGDDDEDDDDKHGDDRLKKALKRLLGRRGR